jgi:hypothetical protein
MPNPRCGPILVAQNGAGGLGLHPWIEPGLAYDIPGEPGSQRYKVFLGFIADAMNLSCQVAGDEQQAYLVGYPLQLPAP